MPLRRIAALAALALLAVAGTRLRQPPNPLPSVSPTSACPASLDEAPVAERPALRRAAARTSRSSSTASRRPQGRQAVKALYLEIDGLARRLGQARRAAPRRRRLPQDRQEGRSPTSKAANRRTTCWPWPATRSACPKPGWLMLTGMRAEVSFYKDLFDKIGVKADMLQMGDFKGAAEPFTRTEMSDASPQAARRRPRRLLRQEPRRHASSRPARARSCTAEQVKKLIDERPVHARRRRWQAGLIDRVAYADDFQDVVQGGARGRRGEGRQGLRQGQDEGRRPVQPVRAVEAAQPAEGRASRTKPKVAVIYADGRHHHGQERRQPVRRASRAARRR